MELVQDRPAADQMDVARVQERIQQLYEELSPQLKQAARHVLAHPEEVALTSMRRLAQHAGVKPSTMVRLARALGFDGFEVMREPYRQWLRGGEGAYVARARNLQARGEQGAVSLVREMMEADAAAIGGMAGDDDRVSALLACRKTLVDARRVYVLGLRSMFSLAHYFHYAYGMAYDNGRLVHGNAGTVFDGLRGVGPEDALICFSFRPYARETVLAADVAADAGASIIAISDSVVSPIALRARHVLAVENASPSFFNSIVPAMGLVQALVAAVIADGGDKALDTISEAEEQLAKFNAYWQEPRRRRKT
ncbi:transcriptional regulator, RpiR family [Caenispirillum salinarum AK4]|uniref:Transcriptional regulator, RpiR family n=1 Tax=Caenispirillum salinarum AK4 TaxID=1238182 RepID=K9GVH5_9PROT|nr:MurR/RpiR family transcriptional regulator [Caenispirillum salinarum]EKV29187.1 transcriptional regulator, RpiR family [Caenispirillum salinarum AK4]